MSSDPQDDKDKRRSSTSGSRRNQPFSFFSDVQDSPSMKLQKSLAAQQALSKPSLTTLDFSTALIPPRQSIIEEFRQKLSLQNTLQKTVSTELTHSALALRTSQYRILAAMQTLTQTADIKKTFQDSIRRESVLPQIVSGRLLAEMRSLVTARAHAASAMHPYLEHFKEARKLASNDILSSIRAAVSTQAAIRDQLESVRQSKAFRPNLTTRLEAIRERVSVLRLDKLLDLVEEITPENSFITDLSEANSEVVAAQIETELATIPESNSWGIEEQLNYLIDWTAKQDAEEMKRNIISFLINILAAIVFNIGTLMVSCQVQEGQKERPQIIVQYVSQQIQEYSIYSTEAVELRIVCKKAIPVKKTRRRRSQKIATLYAGALVRACEKRRKWVRIEWTDLETGIAMEGWVFSKHLTRISKTEPHPKARKSGFTPNL